MSGEDDYVDASGDGDKMIPYVAGANGCKHKTVERVKFSLDAANVDDIQRVLGHCASDPLHLPDLTR
jgi:hypothetical protein